MDKKTIKYEMYYNEIKKMIEQIYDIITEQGEIIESIQAKISLLTNPTPVKKGLTGLAEILGCSKTTAHKWLKTGKIPFSKIGGIYLFDVNEVRNAIKKLKP
jgi:excisionase family DNA binding protein